MNPHSGKIQRKGVINNKVQNKDILDRIVFHRQHGHIIVTISKILWTNDWIVKALVTVSQQIKAGLIVSTFFSLFKLNDETYPLKKNTAVSSIQYFAALI